MLSLLKKDKEGWLAKSEILPLHPKGTENNKVEREERRRWRMEFLPLSKRVFLLDYTSGMNALKLKEAGTKKQKKRSKRSEKSANVMKNMKRIKGF